MEDLKDLEVLKHVREYFLYHADQRLRCIRYFGALLLALIAGLYKLAMLLKGSEPGSEQPYILILLAGVMIFAWVVSFFFLIDLRNSSLLEKSKGGIRFIEEKYISSDRYPRKDFTIMNETDNGCTPCYKDLIAWASFILLGFSLLASIIISCNFWENLNCCGRWGTSTIILLTILSFIPACIYCSKSRKGEDGRVF
jgi:hypothetical protein